MLSRAFHQFSRYQHKWLDGTLVDPSMRTASKILCVARNYTDNPLEKTEPISKRMENAAIFFKPPSSLVDINPSISLKGYTDVVCETEMVLLIGQEIPRSMRGCSSQEAKNSVAGITIGFDFTRKDLQNKLKAVGKPWELAKAFDGACPIGGFMPIRRLPNLLEGSQPTRIQLALNDEIVLSQSLTDMILSPLELIQLLTQHFTLVPGDVIMSGTPTLPQQPPRLKAGDKVIARIGEHIEIHSKLETI